MIHHDDSQWFQLPGTKIHWDLEANVRAINVKFTCNKQLYFGTKDFYPD
jgi:hypothetical protein